jgi:hypothetical protein
MKDRKAARRKPMKITDEALALARRKVKQGVKGRLGPRAFAELEARKVGLID